jgi:hypothetical protein
MSIVEMVFKRASLPQVVSSQMDDMISVQRLHAGK